MQKVTVQPAAGQLGRVSAEDKTYELAKTTSEAMIPDRRRASSPSHEFGVPRAYIRLVAGPSDLQTWKAMDKAALDLAQALAGSPDRIQYLYDNAWRTEPFPLDRPFPKWHQGLGSTYHESSTLWMGDNQATSVTDPVGRFHHISNAYACDQSISPTVGSVNPVLTGLTLSSRLADHLPL